MINNKKIALIHVAKNQLGLDDGIYRDILYREAQVRSSKDLNEAGFEAVMNCFNEMGFQSTSNRRKKKRKVRTNGTVTPEQQEYINDLYDKLGWDSPKRRIGFNKRQIGKPWAQTVKEASDLIEGLKAMLNRGYS
jgi:hypothetical protein